MGGGDRTRAGRPGDPPGDGPYRLALGLLVRREHSRYELERKLAMRGVDPDAAHDVVARLAEEGHQDEARFAASLARARAGAGYGPLRIHVELAGHGIPESLIGSALDGLEADWREIAQALVTRRYGEPPLSDPGLRRRAQALLLRRGFPGDLAWALTGHRAG